MYFHYRLQGRDPPVPQRPSVPARRTRNKLQRPAAQVVAPDDAQTGFVTVADAVASASATNHAQSTAAAASSDSQPQANGTRARRATGSGDVEMTGSEADADGEAEEEHDAATPTTTRPATPPRTGAALPSTPASAAPAPRAVSALASPAPIFPGPQYFSAPPMPTSSTFPLPSGSPSRPPRKGSGTALPAQNGMMPGVGPLPPHILAALAADGIPAANVQAGIASLIASGQIKVPPGATLRAVPVSMSMPIGAVAGPSRGSAPPAAPPSTTSRAASKAPPAKTTQNGLSSPFNSKSKSGGGASSIFNNGGSGKGGGGGSSTSYESFWQDQTSDMKKYEALLNHPNPQIAAAAANVLKAQPRSTPSSSATPPLPSATFPYPSTGGSAAPAVAQAKTAVVSVSDDPAVRAARLGVSRRPSPIVDESRSRTAV